jgi:two-component system phosphate regulon sensor histidine kinase PhoR
LITDNGNGIEENEIPYIFDKFHRVQNEKTETIKGFGLGLFYVKKIVELHGWKIKAKNQPNKGLQFEIIIPKKDWIPND